MSTKADEFDYPETIPDAALFVAADEPLLVFPSVTAAEQHLEAIDVENGVYPAAYGPRGEPYSVETFEGQVVIQATDGPKRPDELKTLLLRYLQGSGRNPKATAPIEALVAEVWKIESDFWREHDPFGDRFGTRIPLWGCLAFMLLSVTALYIAFR